MSEQQHAGRPNKSARKREIAALHALAERMLELSDKELASLGVADDLLGALADVRAIRSSGARNRQLKHCVKLMDKRDLDQVESYLDDRQSQRVAVNQTFHRLEAWRERLINGGDEALTKFLSTHRARDRQHLRQLCRDAARERETGKPVGAARKLFRYLRDDVSNDNG